MVYIRGSMVCSDIPLIGMLVRLTVQSDILSWTNIVHPQVLQPTLYVQSQQGNAPFLAINSSVAVFLLQILIIAQFASYMWVLIMSVSGQMVVFIKL